MAAPGVSIIVAPGTYRENLDLLGKGLYLTAVNPQDPGGGPCVVLEGTGGGPVVRFDGGHTKCGLDGFIVTRGTGQPAALYCDGASPTINHCLIVGNRTTDPNGAAIYCRDSQAVLTNCTLADNYGGAQGAGLVLLDSDVTVINSIFWGDRPQEILRRGTSQPSIRYCDVQGWWPDYGNINLDPLFARRGVWVNGSDPGEAVRPEDNRAVWTAGDYHLQSQAGRWDPARQGWVQDMVSSPSIDRGEKTTAVGNEPAPNGGIINQGVYGGTTEASKSGAGQ